MDFSKFPYIRELGGHVIDVRRLIDPNNKNWGATNLSIGNYKNKYVGALRSSNYVIMDNGSYTVTEGSLITSKIYWGEFNKEWKLENLRQIDTSIAGDLKRGLEDPKVFYRDGAWHLTCVVMDKGDFPYARMAIARLDSKCTKFVSFKVLNGMDTQRPEKNWMMPYEPNPHFDFIYGPNSTVQNNMMTMLFTDVRKLSQLRGNTNLLLLEDGTYLGVMHRTFVKNEARWAPERFSTQNASVRNYIHYYVRFDSRGTILEISNGFQFFLSGIEFAAGLVAHKDNFLISFGRQDVSSHLAVMPKELVLKSLIPVEY
jgi:hypothetical protein